MSNLILSKPPITPDLETITNNPSVKFHHTATAQGYISRKLKEPVIEPYIGRFGRGYKVHYPRFDTTKYHCVTYYIYEEE